MATVNNEASQTAQARQLEQQAPPPVYQTPDWETPTHPRRASLFGRLLPSRPSWHPTIPFESSNRPHDGAGAKEGSAASSTLPTHHQASSYSPSTLRARFDKLLPPHRTYFGRPRRFFLLYILLPLLVLLVVILPLAIGLGVGLSRRHNNADNLPLPSNTGVFTGDLTYYDPALGACGITSAASESICAVSHVVFDAAGAGLTDPNANPLCGRRIRITRERDGGGGNRSVDVTVVDRCVGCAATDLDVTLSVFTQLAAEESGRVIGSWAWL